MNHAQMIAGTNSNGFVGTKESIGKGHSSEEKLSSQDYILLPLWKDYLLFHSSTKNASNDEPKPSSDSRHKDDEGVRKESRIGNQERLSINTASLDVNTARLSINIASANDNAEVDLSNISNTYQVLTTLNTRIHKDHSLDHVIGDVQSGVLKKSKLMPTNEQGFISAIYEGKTHEDLNTCLFACFLSQIEPIRVAKALFDPAWVEAMNKKDEKGIVIKNKERLVTQGYTQEEGIDYDAVFAPVARIKAIRLFIAYALFMGFVVYQIDIKSAFLYGRIEEEVYVCQPLGFEELDYLNKVYKVVKALYGLYQAPRACTTVDMENPLVKDAYGDDIDVHLYISMIGSLMYLTTSRPDIIDYARASLDRKTITGDCQFLSSRLISWQCKKQTVVATYTTKAKYVTAASYCGNYYRLRIKCWIMEKPTESKGFEKIIDFLNANLIKFALTVNPMIFVTPSHSNKIFANMKRKRKDFSGKVTPLFEILMVQPQEDRGKDSKIPIDSHHTPNVPQPSTSFQPQKKKKSNKSKKKITKGMSDQDMFDTSILDDEEVVAETEVNTMDLVFTTSEVVTTAGVEVSIASITYQISMDEITLANALIDIKTSKHKAKGIDMQEPSGTPTPTTIYSSQPSKDKAKAKLK
nr:hypothetical protein [Tanacetum cinerariifolium]